MSRKIRVGILFGGRSAEHEVSLQSARNVINALDRDKYDAVLTPLNYGSWEVEPLGPGKSRLTYRVVSNPGGNIPAGPGQLLEEGHPVIRQDALLQSQPAVKGLWDAHAFSSAWM